MDEAIKNLGEWTDEATKQMLQSLVNKKRKFDRHRQFHLLFMWMTMIIIFLYLSFLAFKIIFPHANSFSAMVSAFINWPGNTHLLLLSIGLYAYMNVLKEKVDKLESEYHALRCEIIDKSNDLWGKGEAWEKRHIVFQMMKERYDINLFYESK
ncbi:YpbF family protein [Fervidibacillus halotolerans]|uniref:YpbF family protein n=1 Tax=Fervidibacillus halotolerans TaxID=2980027 RepID=A0A9E8M201_9BACI|nr:YpbF family protein [Fervidibacillus halotolerans]WAA13789.1 YpbF family protein [Fervidibacillus halotolerans]